MNKKRNFNKKKLSKDELKNKIFSIIIFVLIIFWTVGSVFGFISFGRSSVKDDEKQGIIYASADDSLLVYDFMIPQLNGFLLSTFNGSLYSAVFQELHFSFDAEERYLYVGESLRTDSYFASFDLNSSYSDFFTTEVFCVPITNYPLSSFGTMTLTCCCEYSFLAGNSYSYSAIIPERVEAECYDFFLDVLIYFVDSSGAEIGSCLLSFTYVNGGVSMPLFDIAFMDGGFLESGTGMVTLDLFHYGESLIVNTTALQAEYRKGLERGKELGVSEAISDGTVVGSVTCQARIDAAVSAAVSQAVKNGDVYTRENYFAYGATEYNRGYGDGLSFDSSKLSFNGLLSSVIDVPVNAFLGLFNFELLGVNLSSFFLTLLTICAIIAVIRLIL